MNTTIKTANDPDAAVYIEYNMAEEMTLWGHVSSHSVLYREQELLWVDSGKSFFNGVLLTNLRDYDAQTIDRMIRQKIAHFEAHHQRFSWSVGPSTYPVDLQAYLLKYGFTPVAESAALTLNLQDITLESPQSSALFIREATELADMEIKRDIEQAGFTTSAETAQDYYCGHIGVGFGPDASWHHYIGHLHGQPVAICTLLLYAGVAGVYGIATLPQVRRQGIGTAMTYYALRMARLSGYCVAVLTDTDMSRNIYQRIGFRERCRVYHYGWSPERGNI